MTALIVGVILLCIHLFLTIAAFLFAKSVHENAWREFAAAVIVPLIGPVMAIIGYINIVSRQQDAEDKKKIKM